MAKETRKAGKALVTLTSNTLTFNVQGRPGTQKLHLDGANGVQRYIKPDGADFDVALKQAQGLDVPNFTLPVPQQLAWKSFGNRAGGETTTAQLDMLVGNVPVTLSFRKRTKVESNVAAPVITQTTTAPITANHAPVAVAVPVTEPVGNLAKGATINGEMLNVTPTQAKGMEQLLSQAEPATKPATKPAVKANHRSTKVTTNGSTVTISAALQAYIAEAVAAGIAAYEAKRK